MKVLVACEFSGVVREAFRKRGHQAISCDLLDAEPPSKHHMKKDVTDLLLDIGWCFDLIIAHPPCTHLASSGARWFKDKQAEQEEAIKFFLMFTRLNCPRICIENPIGIMSSKYRKPDQIVQPWMFGHPETKATCLWLKGLPLLKPTNDVREEMLRLPAKERSRIHYMSPSADRGKLRSITYQGMADAMAAQWG